MNKFGKPLIIIGAIILLVAFNMDVSVESGYGRVNNFGLMADRSKYLLLGALLVVVGLLVNFKTTASQSADTSSDSGEIKCPFCAELIKKDAKLCKHCKSHIHESPPITSTSIADLGESINSASLDKYESPSAMIYSAPQAPTTVDRSSLNKSYSEEFSSSLREDQIKSALACAFDKVTKGFDPETLLGFEGKTVVTEATLFKIEDNKWKIKIDFSEKSRYWFASKILFCAFVISAIAGLAELSVVILIGWPIIIILINVICLGDTVTKIKPAIESFKHSIQNIQSNPEGASSSLLSLKLVSVGESADEVKAVIRKALGLGVNDTNDLVSTAPCVIVSGLAASDITQIKDNLIRAGASVDIQNS